MKYFGGLVVLLYAAMALSGWEPFTTTQARSRLPDEARRGPNGVFLWTGGFHGGK
jgi:hypothetical protein